MNKEHPVFGDPNADTAVKAIAALGMAATEADPLDISTDGLGGGLPPTVPVLFNHHDGKLVSVKPIIEEMRQAPARRKGSAKVLTLASFTALTNRHKDGDSAIFAQTAWPDPSLTTIVDYHQADGTPRWGNHRVVYTFPITEELKAWVGQNGKPMEQVAFAAFLEEHAAELAAPYDQEKNEYERLFKERMAVPTDLLSLSSSLEVFVGAKVKRAERLQTGERIVEFVEEHTNSKGEKVDIPGLFIVSVPAFIDGAPVRIPARLRYRISGGSIVWFYQLYRWETALRERVQNDLDIAAKETGLPSYEGTPEAV